MFTDELDSQALAALRPTAGQYGATTLGGHTGTETMAFSALALVGLISAFHIYNLSCCEKSASVRLA